MWPKMLLELLPHLTRLIPMADRFFATRSASEKAQEAALAALAESVRGDLAQVSGAHSGLAQRIEEQGALLTAQIGLAAVEATKARMAAESVEARITKLEQRSQTMLRLLLVILVILVLTAIAMTLLIVRGR